MRTEPRPTFASPEAEEAWLAATSTADWRDAPADILDLVDSGLKAHGLEVVLVESTGDGYEWRIEKRIGRRQT